MTRRRSRDPFGLSDGLRYRYCERCRRCGAADTSSSPAPAPLTQCSDQNWHRRTIPLGSGLQQESSQTLSNTEPGNLLAGPTELQAGLDHPQADSSDQPGSSQCHQSNRRLIFDSCHLGRKPCRATLIPEGLRHQVFSPLWIAAHDGIAVSLDLLIGRDNGLDALNLVTQASRRP